MNRQFRTARRQAEPSIIRIAGHTNDIDGQLRREPVASRRLQEPVRYDARFIIGRAGTFRVVVVFNVRGDMAMSGGLSLMLLAPHTVEVGRRQHDDARDCESCQDDERGPKRRA